MTGRTPLGQTNTHVNAYLQFPFPQIHFWMKSEIRISKGAQCQRKIYTSIQMSVERIFFLLYSKAEFVTLKIRLQLTLEIKALVKTFVSKGVDYMH